MGKKYKLGIALSGGGARGFAHLGVIKALKEKGFEPDIYAGVSAGSIVGALIASGLTTDEAFNAISNKGFFKYTSIQVPVKGFFNLEGLQKKLLSTIKVKRIEELQKPLIVVATNLNKGKTVYFEKGELDKIVIASSSIPVLFSPVEIDGDLYVDGGVMENLPIPPLKGICDKIIAVNVSPIVEIDQLDNIIKIGTRVVQLRVDDKIYGKEADLLIVPEGIANYDTLDHKKAKEMYELGYDFVKKMEIQL